MPRVHTHYDNLKVARNAPPEVIRAAYKTLSQKYHPDRNGNSPEAIRVIQLVNSAYAVLSDPDKRREHDEWIARAEAQAQQPNAHTPEYREHQAPRSGRRPSRRSRRKGSLVDLVNRQLFQSQPLLKWAHKFFDTLDHLSRKLFRKT